MKEKQLCILLSFFTVFVFISSPAFARDWNTTDADLPPELQSMSQGQLDIVNKTDELNPASPDYSPDALRAFKQFGVAPASPATAPSTQTPPVSRSEHNTTVFPSVGTNFANEIGGSPTGTGLGPSPTDGPVVRSGEPSAQPARSPDDRMIDQVHFGTFFGELFLGKEGFDQATEGAFIDPFGRSGARFGDCVGADCIPHVGFPGEPLGGPPRGSWIQHDSRFLSHQFANDAAVLEQVRNNNFVAAENLLEAALGQEVRHDPNAKPF